MKTFLLFFLILSLSHLSAQNLIAWEQHQNGSTFMVEIGKDGIHKTPTDNWLEGKLLLGNLLMGANAYGIYRQQGRQTDTLLDVRRHAGIPEIIGFSANDQQAVLATYQDLNAYELKRGSMQLFLLDKASGALQQLSLPDSLNFSNISLSPSGKYLAFVHLQNYNANPRKPLHDEAMLMVMVLSSGKLVNIHEVALRQDVWFQGGIKWTDDQRLLFLTRRSKQQKVELSAYDLREGTIKTVSSYSVGNFEDFSYCEETVYFINGSEVFRLNKDGSKKVIYKCAPKAFLKGKLMVE
jgi:hypothetical protein